MSQSAVTGREACERLRVSRQTLDRLRKSGQLPSFTIGRARRYPVEGLDALIESRLTAESGGDAA